MTFIAYVQRQKNLIRDRHTAETYLISGNDVIFIDDGTPKSDKTTPRTSEEILDEIDNMRGLNTIERARYSRTKNIRRNTAC
jgi:hypothetical protein